MIRVPGTVLSGPCVTTHTSDVTLTSSWQEIDVVVATDQWQFARIAVVSKIRSPVCRAIPPVKLNARIFRAPMRPQSRGRLRQ